MRSVRICTPPLAFSPPSSLNFTRTTKFVNRRVVERNSLRGTAALIEPPTNEPSTMRQVLFVSPSHPVKVLPSKSGTGLDFSAAASGRVATRQRRKTRDRFMNGLVLIDE